MNAIGRCLQINEGRQVGARLPVRSETHDLPFIAVGLKPEKLSETAVKESDGVRKGNRQEVFEPAVAPVPKGRGFPGAAPVHHGHGSFVEAGIRVRANGMGEVMVHEAHFRPRGPELLREFLRSALLVPHAQEVQRGIQSVEVRQGHFRRRVTPQIMPKYRSRRLPAVTHFV